MHTFHFVDSSSILFFCKTLIRIYRRVSVRFSMSSHSENLQPWTIATTASVTALALVAVCLRLLSRYEKKQKLWWDDWMILWSMVHTTHNSVNTSSLLIE